MNELINRDAFLTWLKENEPFSVEIFEGIRTPEVILGEEKWILGQFNNDLFICMRVDLESDPHLFPISALDSGKSPLRKKITVLIKSGIVLKSGEGKLTIS
jgi:hypothetical protein